MMIKSIIKSDTLKIVLMIGIIIFLFADLCFFGKKMQKLENEKFENYVIIQLPNGKIFEGKADSYTTENFGEMITVQIGNEIYKTDRKNVVIIKKRKNPITSAGGKK